jgi:hypothetical protein
MPHRLSNKSEASVINNKLQDLAIEDRDIPSPTTCGLCMCGNMA